MGRFWLPRFCFKKYDGGPTSNVTGYWLLEWKAFFSFVILKVDPGHNERFHTHAFDAISWYVRGECEEHMLAGTKKKWSFKKGPKWTSTETFHRVSSEKGGWIVSVRGPWIRNWKEYKDGVLTYLTNGRQVLNEVAIVIDVDQGCRPGKEEKEEEEEKFIMKVGDINLEMGVEVSDSPPVCDVTLEVGVEN